MATPQLTVGLNSYASLAYAAEYLSGSVAGAGWEFVPEDTQVRSMLTAARILERQRWRGERTDMTIVAALAVSAAGTLYVVGNELAISGGTGTVAAQLEVSAVGGGGEVSAALLLDTGLYSVAPSTPAAGSGGAGSGATFALTTSLQVMAFPRTGLVDLDGNPLASDVVPEVMLQAQCEMASVLAAKASQERAGGTGNEIKALGAGSARIEYFRPTSGTRFPAHVHEMIRHLLEGSSMALVQTGGSGATSAFGDDQTAGLTQGYY